MHFSPLQYCDRFFLNMDWDDFLTNGGNTSIQNAFESDIVLTVPKMEEKNPLDIHSDDPLDPTKNSVTRSLFLWEEFEYIYVYIHSSMKLRQECLLGTPLVGCSHTIVCLEDIFCKDLEYIVNVIDLKNQLINIFITYPVYVSRA